MSRYDDHADETDLLRPPLADAVDRLRAERPDPQTVHRAADRVWRRLAQEAAAGRAAVGAAAPGTVDPAAAIAGCAGFVAQIPSYIDGTLAPERRLLLEDHSRECVPCRRALNAARRGETASSAVPAAGSGAAPAGELAAPHGIGPQVAAGAPAAARPAGSRFRFAALAAAAALVAMVGIGAWLALAPGGPAAVVAAADGELFRVAAGGAVTTLAAGDELAESEVVRTARDGGAVIRLADGSAVELAGGTELAVGRGFFDTTIRLGRGHVIVEAAERGRGHLFVATDDCKVAVTGTIFAVNHGVKGSRVSVIEGEVRVASGGGGETVLQPGQQVTTRATLTAVPVASEVAWSRHHERYVALLRELDAIGRAIEERVERPGLRYASALIDRAPASSAALVAMPNLSGQVAEGYAVFREQLATSPVLAAWWAEHAEAGPHLERMVTALADFGAYLGDEVVVAFPADESIAYDAGPVILAEVVRPGFAAFLDQEAARWQAEAGRPVLVPVADPHAAPAGAEGLLVWPGDGLMIAAHDPALLALAAGAAAGAAPALPGTPLHDRLTEAYAGGVEWLFAADFALIDFGGGAEDEEMRAGLGVADLDFLLIEHHGAPGEGFGGRAQTAAELSFRGTRRGMASWLAEPAPMGSLGYVSPDAAAAFAVVTKEPAAMFEDLFSMLLAEDPAGAEEELSRTSAELGVDPRDLAAALGGEVTFAVDGPLLPEPSWKLIVEVDDPALLQASLETMIARIAAAAAERGEETVPALEPGEPVGGRPAWRIACGPGVEGHYLYADGYLVAAASRALLARALDQRASGFSLASSARFRALVPADGHANFSGLFYQHLGPALAPLVDAAGGIGALGEGGGGIDPAQARALAALAGESEPTLAVAYGEPDAIRFAATSPHGAFGLGYRALLGVGGLGALADEAREGVD